MRWARSNVIAMLLLLGVLGSFGAMAFMIYRGEVADVALGKYGDNAGEAQERSRRVETQHNCLPLPPAERDYCKDQAARSARERERQEYEFVTSIKNANWTKAQGTAAAIGLFFSMVTILLLYLNYEAERGAKIQARQDATDMLNETRRIGEAQTRAYLSIGACKIMFDDAKLSVSPTIRNSGQSPALEVSWVGRISMMIVEKNSNKSSNFRMGETNPEFRNQCVEVPAQGERETLWHNCKDEFGLSPPEMLAFLDDKRVAITIAITASGKDVFGGPIEGRDDFIQILREAPENLIEYKMTLGSRMTTA